MQQGELDGIDGDGDGIADEHRAGQAAAAARDQDRDFLVDIFREAHSASSL